jgi:hypothetical protein
MKVVRRGVPVPMCELGESGGCNLLCARLSNSRFTQTRRSLIVNTTTPTHPFFDFGFLKYSPEEINDLGTAGKWPGTAACGTEADSDVMLVEEWPGTTPREKEAESDGKEWPDTTRRG